MKIVQSKNKEAVFCILYFYYYYGLFSYTQVVQINTKNVVGGRKTTIDVNVVETLLLDFLDLFK